MDVQLKMELISLIYVIYVMGGALHTHHAAGQGLYYQHSVHLLRSVYPLVCNC